jgi:MFS family permease
MALQTIGVRNVQFRGLLLLALTLAAASYGRAALGPLQEAIKTDVGLSDNFVSFVQGPALAWPIVVAGVPLGILVDRYNRTRLLLVLVVLTTASTALAAEVGNPWQLLAARCLTGLSVFATFPVAVSLLADLYPPAQRGRATMVLTIGQFAGASLAFVVGGWLLNELSSWRSALQIMAIPPGLVGLAMLTMQEPRRSRAADINVEHRSSWAEIWHYRKQFAPLLVGVVIVEVALGAVLIWSAPSLARNFNLDPAQIGSIIGMVIFVSGIGGALLGGLALDVAQRRGGVEGALKILRVLTFASIPAGFYALVHNLAAAAVMLTLFIGIIGGICVMGTALLTIILPGRVHGLALSIMTIAGVGVGIGLAPVTVSATASALGGETYLSEAITLVCAVSSAIAGLVFAKMRFDPIATL